MRLSSYLSNREVFLAALCGALLAPVIWAMLISLQVISEWMKGVMG